MFQYKIGSNREKDHKLIIDIGFFAILYAIIFRLSSGFFNVDNYSTTSYAFSYLTYGISSRMLLGTIYDVICKVCPPFLSWWGCFIFMMFIAILFIFILIKFVLFALDKTQIGSKARKAFLCFSTLCLMWLIPSYLAGQNFGKTDTFIFIVNILQVYLILKGKCEWAVPLLSLLGVCTHEGYLCMTACVSIALLLYKAVTNERKLYYWSLFALNLVAICAPAVYFVFFKTKGDEEQWLSAFALAKSLNKEGSVHIGYVSQRLNYSPEFTKGTSNDANLKAKQIKQIPFFLLLIIPTLRRFFKTIKESFTIKRKGLLWAMLLIAPALIFVEFYIFCDFGRYVTWLIFYYFMLGIFFVATFPSQEIGEIYVMKNKQLLTNVFYICLLTPLLSSSFNFLTHVFYWGGQFVWTLLF